MDGPDGEIDCEIFINERWDNTFDEVIMEEAHKVAEYVREKIGAQKVKDGRWKYELENAIKKAEPFTVAVHYVFDEGCPDAFGEVDLTRHLSERAEGYLEDMEYDLREKG